MKFRVRNPKLKNVTVEVSKHTTEAGGTGRSLLRFAVEGRSPFRTVEIPDELEAKIVEKDLLHLIKLGPAEAADETPAG